MNTDNLPCWSELTTPDLAAAQTFYGGVFGWTFAEPGPMGFGVTALLDGQPVAGISPQPEQAPEGQPGFWSQYFKVADVTEFIEAVEGQGGQPLMAIPNFDEHASVALVADSTGTAFGVLSFDDDRGYGVTGVDGAAAWWQVFTKSGAQVSSADFYSTVFGWSLTADPHATGASESLIITSGGQEFGGMLDISKSEIPGHWESFFQVADVEATAARVVELGGALLTEPQNSPRGRIGRFIDDHNAAFTVIAPTQIG